MAEEVHDLQYDRPPQLSRMQRFAINASDELSRLAEAEAQRADSGILGESGYLPETDDPELQAALCRLLRVEKACDFEGAVRDADKAARAARPGVDAERVASMAATASARRRASERASAHAAHIVEVIREPLPSSTGASGTAAGERRMEIIGYVGVTGTARRPRGHSDQAV